MTNKIFTRKDLLSIQKNTSEFLMMDEVEVLKENKVKGKKFFGEDFWIFKHHWPGDPNVPAVFQTEAMSQISSILILGSPENNNKSLLVDNSNNLKFKKKILPNDTLIVFSLQPHVKAFQLFFFLFFWLSCVSLLFITPPFV